MQEELIQKFRDGDKQAGDDFYNANINLVKYAVKRFKLESMDNEETYAIVNQAFAKCMQIFDTSKGAFSTCFMANARGHILNHFRDHGNIVRSTRQDYIKNKVVFCDSLDRVIYNSESVDICLKDTFGMEDDESQTFVNEAISKLNKSDRNIFNLYHIGGFSQLEIGKMFGTTQVQISRSLSRSKASLKIILKEVS